MLFSLIAIPISIVYILSNLNYKRLITIIITPLLSIAGGLVSAAISTPQFFIQDVVEVQIDNKIFLGKLIFHTGIIFLMVVIYYPFLAKRFRRKNNLGKVESSTKFMDIFKTKNQKLRDEDREWIKKNFK